MLGANAITRDLNFLEAAARLLQQGESDPWQKLDALGISLFDHERVDLVTAAALKVAPALRSRNLSYIDALGYAVALRWRYAFVTGDRGFRELPGVEWLPV